MGERKTDKVWVGWSLVMGRGMAAKLVE